VIRLCCIIHCTVPGGADGTDYTVPAAQLEEFLWKHREKLVTLNHYRFDVLKEGQSDA